MVHGAHCLDDDSLEAISTISTLQRLEVTESNELSTISPVQRLLRLTHLDVSRCCGLSATQVFQGTEELCLESLHLEGLADWAIRDEKCPHLAAHLELIALSVDIPSAGSRASL